MMITCTFNVESDDFIPSTLDDYIIYEYGFKTHYLCRSFTANRF